MNRLALFLTIYLALTLSLYAEVYECSGTWTDRPCSELKDSTRVKPKINIDKSERGQSESKHPSTDRIADLKVRKKMIAELDALRFRSKQEHDVRVNIVEVEAACLDLSISLMDCSKLVSEKEELIHKLVLAAKQDSEVAVKSGKVPSIEQNQVTVTNTHQEADIVLQHGRNNTVVNSNLPTVPSPSPTIKVHTLAEMQAAGQR